MTTPTTPIKTASELHAAIMNIPCNPPADANINQRLSYKYGHRDARHAAAELVLAAAQAEQPAVGALTVDQVTAAIHQACKLLIDQNGEITGAAIRKARDASIDAILALAALTPEPAALPAEVEGWHAPGIGEVHNHDHTQMIYCMKAADPDQHGADEIMDDDLAKRVCAALATPIAVQPAAAEAVHPLYIIRDRNGRIVDWHESKPDLAEYIDCTEHVYVLAAPAQPAPEPAAESWCDACSQTVSTQCPSGMCEIKKGATPERQDPLSRTREEHSPGLARSIVRWKNPDAASMVAVGDRMRAALASQGALITAETGNPASAEASAITRGSGGVVTEALTIALSELEGIDTNDENNCLKAARAAINRAILALATPPAATQVQP